MFIQKSKKFHENKDGSVSVYPRYRLMKAYRDVEGKPCKRVVLSMGSLEGMDQARPEKLADMLTEMIEKGQCVMCDDNMLYEKAMEYYANTVRHVMPRRTIHA